MATQKLLYSYTLQYFDRERAMSLLKSVAWKLAFIFALAASNGTQAKKLNGFELNNSLIPVKAIQRGGPPRDGIPAIFNPNYTEAKQANFMHPEDMVLGLEINGVAFAYPRYILNWHELVNAQVAGQHFLVSYCPLCGSGMAFSSSVKGQNLKFGVSGLLYNSDLLFYDRETESLWSQIEGRAVTGPMSGEVLVQLPMEVLPWKAWLVKHPETKVLTEKQGVRRDYRRDPYVGYETSSALYFGTLRKAPATFHPKERVLGVSLGGLSKAYAFSRLSSNQKPRFTDRLGEYRYDVVWDETHQTAHIEGEGGEVLVSTIAFWFAWYNFFPETQLYEPSGVK